jgi:hypothetical protein
MTNSINPTSNTPEQDFLDTNLTPSMLEDTINSIPYVSGSGGGADRAKWPIDTLCRELVARLGKGAAEAAGRLMQNTDTTRDG